METGDDKREDSLEYMLQNYTVSLLERHRGIQTFAHALFGLGDRSNKILAQ